MDRLEAVLAEVLTQPASYPLADVFATPMDVSKWDWSQLNPMNAPDFQWEYGVTPFSNWQVIPITWAIYFAVVVGTKVRQA